MKRLTKQSSYLMNGERTVWNKASKYKVCEVRTDFVFTPKTRAKNELCITLVFVLFGTKGVT